MSGTPPHSGKPARVLQLIARMNLGGPAHNVILLSSRLNPDQFETTVVSGKVPPGEESAVGLAAAEGVSVHLIDSLGPQIAPLRDLRATAELIRLMRRKRPHILHTHTAKAGIVGRVAALTLRPRPRLVHTYHGHVLEGYFGPIRNWAFRLIERRLSRASDCLVAVTRHNVDDLVRLRVAPESKFRVIPLGVEIDDFVDVSPARVAHFREQIGAAPDDVLATWAGRLVPIKRVDRLIRAVAKLRHDLPNLRLVLVGDGPLRAELEELALKEGIRERVEFIGYRTDLPTIAAASDIAVLSSDNEGTPVWLLEAAAAGLPAIATDVGGVRDIVIGSSGFVVSPDDSATFVARLSTLVEDAELRQTLGDAARAHVAEKYSVERLVADTAALYSDLLSNRN